MDAELQSKFDALNLKMAEMEVWRETVKNTGMIAPSLGLSEDGSTIARMPRADHPFRVYPWYDDSTSTWKLRVIKGSVGTLYGTLSAKPFSGNYAEIASGASVYITYTPASYSGTTYTAGSWGDITSGTAPASSETAWVFIIADVNTGGTVPVVTEQRICSDIIVLDKLVTGPSAGDLFIWDNTNKALVPLSGTRGDVIRRGTNGWEKLELTEGDILYRGENDVLALNAPTGFTNDPVLRHNGTAPYWDEPETC